MLKKFSFTGKSPFSTGGRQFFTYKLKKLVKLCDQSQKIFKKWDFKNSQFESCFRFGGFTPRPPPLRLAVCYRPQYSLRLQTYGLGFQFYCVIAGKLGWDIFPKFQRDYAFLAKRDNACIKTSRIERPHS